MSRDLWKVYNHVDFQHSETFSQTDRVSKYVVKSKLTMISSIVKTHGPIWVDQLGPAILATFLTGGLVAAIGYLTNIL